MKKKVLKILKLLIILLFIVLIILIVKYSYNIIKKNKYKSILEESDSTNYQVVQTDGETETIIKGYRKCFGIRN